MKTLIRKTISNTFTHYAEKLFQVSCPYKKAARFIRTRVAVNGMARLDEAMAAGKGVLIVTGHFGAVEFLPSSLSLRGYPLMIMAKFKTKRLRTISLERAARAGFSILDCQNHPRPLMASIRCLKEGNALIVECDETESWHPYPNKRGRFLGREVLVDRTIDLMVKRSNCAVFTAFISRRGNRRYQLDLREIGPPVNGEGIGELSMKTLEKYVSAYPEQWYLWDRFDEMLADKGAPACESDELSSTTLESLFAYR